MLTHLVFLLLAAAIGAAAGYAFHEAPQKTPASEPMALHDHAPMPETRVIGAAQPPAPATQSMQAQFESAGNYAAFIQDALQRPAEGGRFYALMAYLQCSEIAAIKLPAESASDARRASARNEVLARQQRCAGVPAQFPNLAVFLSAIKRSNSIGPADKLLLTRDGLGPASSRELAMQDIERALASGAPYLVAATLELNVEHYADALSPAFARGENRELLYRAASAAACEIGGTCINNVLVLAQCAGAGNCEHTDLRAFLRDGLDPDAQQVFDTAREKIVQTARGTGRLAGNK